MQLKIKDIYKFISTNCIYSRSSYTYIFIDESICDKAGLATLTSIFIPQKKLKIITTDFYRIVKQIVDKFPAKENNSRILYPFPVLHGNSLLKNSTENPDFDFSIIDDDFRILIINQIIDLVLKHKLQIVRLGYNNYKEIRQAKFKDNKMYSTNWLNLSRYIDNSLKIKNAICVMDGNDTKMINTFSRFISTAKTFTYLYPDVEKSSIFGDNKRFVNNVFYVPAKYSEYLQIVDIIAYVLHKKDYIEITGIRSDFSNRIYKLEERLENKRVCNCLTRFNIK